MISNVNHKKYFASSIMEETSCTLCGHSNSEELEKCNVIFDLDVFSIKMVKCKTCGLVYLNPRLNERGLTKFYETYFRQRGTSDYDIEQTNASPRLINRFLNEIEKRVPFKAKLLDVGCGRGVFLQIAKARGWDVYGIEFSRIAASEARQKGLEVKAGTLIQAKYPTSYFDVVTLFNVIEHLQDPLALIKETNRILKNGGILLIRAPNIDWLEFSPVILIRKFRRFLKTITDKNYYFSKTGILNMFMIQHLYYFSRKTLKSLLEKAGFYIETITTKDPWHFEVSWKFIKKRDIKLR